MIESPLLKHLAGFVDGRWTGARSGETLKVINPANGEHLASVPNMGGDETTSAADAADRASRDVPSLEQRATWLDGIVKLLDQHKTELARIITLEQGKPLKESIVEVDYAAGFFGFCARQVDRLRSESLPEPIKKLSWTIHHRPAGVVGLITPWNFPLAMMAKKLSSAIGAGCSVVAKPAELTPLTMIALWHLLEQLPGVPAGRFNLVIGRPAPIGDVLCTHPAVRLISFTGSTEVGRLLIRNTAPHVKRLAMELGGNAPFIVMDDADVNVAVDSLMANKFRCAGQTCVCANRVYVHEKIESDFVGAISERVRKLNVGDGLDPRTDIGPLINRAGFEKVSRHVADAMTRGAQRIVGETREATPGREWGNFFTPTVLIGTRPDMLVAREETFGPVVSIQTFDPDSQVIELANGTPFGLAAYLFTRDDDRAQRVAAQLHFGHVGVNTGSGPTPEAPFGGMKQSGFGREGGVEGLMEFTETQTVARG